MKYISMLCPDAKIIVHSIKLIWNLTLLLSNNSLGNGNLKQEQHSRIISLFTVLNNFIRNRTISTFW